MTFFWNTKEYVLKKARNLPVSIPLYINLYYIFLSLQHWEIICLATKIQNIHPISAQILWGPLSIYINVNYIGTVLPPSSVWFTTCTYIWQSDFFICHNRISPSFAHNTLTSINYRTTMDEQFKKNCIYFTALIREREKSKMIIAELELRSARGRADWEKLV